MMKTYNLAFLLLILFFGTTLFAQHDQDDITFGKYRILHSEILDQDRMLYIHLPKGYEDSDESYPVVFQLYGHFMENYYLPAVRASSLMGELGRSPRMIVVGIMNREFRYRDLLPVDHWQGKSEIEHFVNFFNNELLPFLQKEYRINNYRILSGPQAGAAFGVYTFAKHPDMFSAWILSNPFWIEKARQPLLEMTRMAVGTNDYQNKFMMVSHRQVRPEEDSCLARFSTLMSAVRPNSFRYTRNVMPNEQDFTSPVDIEKGLKALYANYQLPNSVELRTLSDVENHFVEQSRYFGFTITPPEFSLVREGDKLVQARRMEEAIAIFRRMNELYPNGLMAYDRLGGAYRQIGELQEAMKWYQGFLKIQPGNPRMKTILAEIEEELN